MGVFCRAVAQLAGGAGVAGEGAVANDSADLYIGMYSRPGPNPNAVRT